MLTRNQPLRVNLQTLYRWSRFHQEPCGLCKKPAGYGAQVEVYMPKVEFAYYQTEAEELQAADDYCNALADQQEQGNFTRYAMYRACGDCASRIIIEEVSSVAAPILASARSLQHERLWIAVLLQYEPGAYGNYQQILIHSSISASIEQIYARARQSY
jgi:hypothetical protein